MSFETWIAFTLASAALLAIPGPTVMLVISYVLGKGRKSGWATVPGVALGDLTAMTISMAGAGAVLSASATLFTILKLAGAAYLIWLGIGLWRARPEPPSPGAEFGAPGLGGAWRSMFRNSYVVTALNPKSIVFFVAFVPQFMDPTGDFIAQAAVLEATFVTLAAVNVALWVLLVGEMRQRFSRPSALRLANRLGGGFLIGAGVLTAAVRP